MCNDAALFFSKDPGTFIWIHVIMDFWKYQDILKENLAASDVRSYNWIGVGYFSRKMHTYIQTGKNIYPNSKPHSEPEEWAEEKTGPRTWRISRDSTLRSGLRSHTNLIMHYRRRPTAVIMEDCNNCDTWFS